MHQAQLLTLVPARTLRSPAPAGAALPQPPGQAWRWALRRPAQDAPYELEYLFSTCKVACSIVRKG